MGSMSRRKGRTWENAIVTWLRNNGFPNAERNEYLHAQTGDILGIPGWSLEAKNGARLELAAWVDQAAEQAAIADVAYHAVIAKRKGIANPGAAYVITPLAVWAEWMKE